MKAQPTASHWILGPADDISGAPIPVAYAATGEIIAELHAATPAILDQAIAAAAAGFAEWSRTAPSARGRVLRRAADIIRARGEELARLETLDTGKPISETRVADWPSGADALDYFGALAATMTSQSIDLGGDFVYTRREPLGICVGIGAWNYPSQIACWKSAPALACGNAMIFKPSELTPLGALKLAEIFEEAGLPKGVFTVIQGRGDIGAALAARPEIAKISITGSVPTGRRVYAAAAASLKHVTLELGGKSPLIVFDDADIENAISGAMLGNFYSAGQICSNGTRVFVQSAIRDRFLARLRERTESIRLGDPLDPNTQMGPLVSAAQADKVMTYIEKALTEGARLVTGGRRPSGNFIEPTVFADVTDDMTIAREEIFGPVMSVLTFDTEAEVIERANATEFGLAAGVFTADLARGHRVIAQLRAGTTWINAYNLTPVESPFGGVKSSGLGRENGHAALEHYSQIKSVYVGLNPVESPF